MRVHGDGGGSCASELFDGELNPRTTLLVWFEVSRALAIFAASNLHQSTVAVAALGLVDAADSMDLAMAVQGGGRGSCVSESVDGEL